MRRQTGVLTALAATLVAVLAGGLAGAARARPLDLRLPQSAQAPAAVPLAIGGPRTPKPAPDLANPLDPFAPTVIQTGPMESVVFAKTAIDHRFASRQDVTGSLGFLCGLQPGHTDSGGAAAYGIDPHGRFVGAKLSIAFR